MVMVLISGCTGPKQTQIPQSTPNTISNMTVDIKGFVFEPGTITVPRGTTITWTNRDSVSHTVTGNNFGSDFITQNSTYSHLFQDAGTFDYYCAVHTNMKGKVIVT